MKRKSQIAHKIGKKSSKNISNAKKVAGTPAE